MEDQQASQRPTITDPGLGAGAETTRRLLRLKVPEDPTPSCGVSSLKRVDFDRLKGLSSVEGLRQQLQSWQSSAIDPGRSRLNMGDLLGQGGQGLVFSIDDRDCRRQVALKILKTSQTAQRHMARFIHEAQVTAQLEHPGVVPVHDLQVLRDGTVFYTMKRIDGEPLSDWFVNRAGDLDHRYDLLQLFLRICETMAYAHNKGVIHRDLKPLNVMVGAYGEVLIVDWGLAKLLGESDVVTTRQEIVDQQSDKSSDIQETQEGSAIGTLSYMSPEQARGQQDKVDTRSDIFSLGVILYELLSGISPYGDVMLHKDLMHMVSNGTWRRLGLLSDLHLPRQLIAIVDKAMAFDIDQRYQSVTQLADDVKSHLAGQSVLAYRETGLEALLRWTQRNRVMLTTALVVGCVSATLGVGSFLWHKHQQRNRADHLMSEAADFERHGDFQQALGRYNVVLEMFPADPAAVDRRASVSERLEIEQERQRKLVNLQAAEKKAEEAAPLLLSEDIDEISKAMELLTEAKGLAPEVSSYDRDLKRAEARQLSLHADQLVASGLAAIRAGKINDAFADLKAAKELVPTNPRILDLEAKVMAGLDEAERKAKQQDADRLLAKAKKLADDQRDFSEAALLVKAAMEVQPSDEATEALVRYREAARNEERLKAMKRSRDAATRELASAREELDQGRTDLAERYLARAELHDREHPELKNIRDAIVKKVEEQAHAAADRLLDQAVERQRRIDQLTASITQAESGIEQLRQLARNRAGEPDILDRMRAALEVLQRQQGERVQLIQEALQDLHSAHQIDTAYRPSVDALAKFYSQRVLEAGDDSQVAAYIEVGRRFDVDKRFRAVFEGLATLVLDDGEQSLMVRPLGGTNADAVRLSPGRSLEVKAGRYILSRDDGTALAHRFSRGQVVKNLGLPPMPALPESVAFVPPGTVYNRHGRVLTGVNRGFGIARHEVTNAEWLAFLNDPKIGNQLRLQLNRQKRPALFPRIGRQDLDGLWRYRKGAGGMRIFELLVGGVPVPPRAPISRISLMDVNAYIAWRSARDKLAWRLPTAAEWQLAAQSGDGRLWTWGNQADDLIHCLSGRTVKGDVLVDVGSFRSDTSIHGVQDLAGSVSEFVSDRKRSLPEAGLVVGGSWRDLDADRCSTWFVQAFHEQGVANWLGFRLAIDVVDGRPRPFAGEP